jgi:ParB/RepB/Spo0J family partition protein
MSDQLILNFEKIEGVKTEYAVLLLNEVSSDEEMSQRGMVSKPTNSFVDSLRQFGQIDPVLVLEKTEATGEKWYQVWSGSRRVRALRQLAAFGEHEPNIKAQVIKEDWDVPYDVLMMVLNAARDSNEIADYFAIKRLMHENPELNMADIAKALNHNLTNSEIRKRMSLSKIPEPLLNGVKTGMLTLSTARTITKLPRKVQIELSEKVQGSLDQIKEIDNSKYDDPTKKQQVIHDIVREGRIAATSIKQAKIDNANQVATLRLSGLLELNYDKSQTKIMEPKKAFYVLQITGAQSFPTRKEVELFRQKLTAESGNQFCIVEQ